MNTASPTASLSSCAGATPATALGGKYYGFASVDKGNVTATGMATDKLASANKAKAYYERHQRPRPPVASSLSCEGEP
jgi:hypothetical protein